jgi:hypothetical protein
MNWKQKYKLIRWLQKPSVVEPDPSPAQIAMKAAILIDRIVESDAPKLKLFAEMEGFDVR